MNDQHMPGYETIPLNFVITEEDLLAVGDAPPGPLPRLIEEHEKRVQALATLPAAVMERKGQA